MEWMFGINEGFDLVIGNPPYITTALGKKQKIFDKKDIDLFKKIYSDVFEYKGNTYSFFTKKGLELTRRTGQVVYIIPNTLLLTLTFEKLRKFIINNSSIDLLLNITTKVFEGAETGGNLIFAISNKQNSKDIRLQEISNLDFFNSNFKKEYDFSKQNEFKNTPNHKFYLREKDRKFLIKFDANSIKLGKIVKFYQGIITGDNGFFLSKKKTNVLHQKILRGKDINKYSYKFNNNYILFDKEKLWSNTNESMFRINEKLINRQTGDSLIAAYDDGSFLSLDSTHVQILIDTNFDLKYILALFNSSLINFYYKSLVQETGRTFAQVKTVNLKMLPIFKIGKTAQEPFIKKVNEILDLKKKNVDTTALEQDIDNMVYKLYGLTYEEVLVVQPDFGAVMSAAEYEAFEI
jgi:hypothetical protein